MKEKFESYFSIIEDTRCQCDITYKLTDILILVICAVLCNMTTLSDIVDFGYERLEFLNKHFNIDKIPSKSTISKVLSIIDAEYISFCVVDLMKDLYGMTGEVIAIDGKVIRSTEKMKKFNKSLHIMTAYMTENGISIGQLSINEKTNEIPCMRELLNIIDIKDKVITADAMHCQKKTLKKIIDNGGDYVIQIKGNQSNTSEDIKLVFEDLKNSRYQSDKEKYDIFEVTEKGHGRIEKRICRVLKDITWLENINEWEGLKSIFSVERIVEKNGVKSHEESYYISSLETNPEKFMKISRQHWHIESMHWILDVVMNEDKRQLQSIAAQKVINIFSKMAISIHKNYIANMNQKTKPSIKRNMTKCLLSEKHLESLLMSL